MSRIQLHHIEYDPEWAVELNMLMHHTISRIQVTKATEEHYADVTNFMHSLAQEWNRMRKELDLGGDLRVMSSGEGKLVRELRSECRRLKKLVTELKRENKKERE